MFLVVLLVYPLVELGALIWVAGMLGWFPTLLIAVVCTVVGVWQLKVQGLESWRRVSEEIRKQRMPGAALLDGTLRMTAAVLLAVPGLVSSVLSLFLFFAPTRAAAARVVTTVTTARFSTSMAVVSAGGRAGARVYRRGHGTDILDVDGWEDPASPRGGSAGELPRPPDV